MTDSNTSEEHIETNEEIVEEPLSELEQLKQDLEEANETKLRALADFKNYQRRSVENEIRATNSAKAEIVRSILPSIEQMNMAIEHADADDDAVVKGFQMALDGLLQGLAECGVTSIEPRDRRCHLILKNMKLFCVKNMKNLEPDHIVLVMQTGFQLGDIVISPAKVAVSS